MLPTDLRHILHINVARISVFSTDSPPFIFPAQKCLVRH